MSSSFLRDVVFLLEEAELGVYGSQIFLGAKAVLPIGDGPYISIIPTVGLDDEGTHNVSATGIAYERPSATLVTRALNFDDAYDTSIRAREYLNFVNRFVNRTWWRLCRPKGMPHELNSPDDKGRTRIVFTIDSVKRTSPETS